MSARSLRAHLRNGEPGLARAAGRALMAQEPSNVEIRVVLARALVQCGDVAEALALAEAAEREHPGWESAVALCEAWLGMGFPERAVAAVERAEPFVRAVDVDGSGSAPVEALAAVGVARAEALRAAGRVAEALALARSGVRLADQLDPPERAQVLQTLGAVALAADCLGEARAALDVALRLREGAADVAAVLDCQGQLERRDGNPERAVALHREALSRYQAHFGPKSAPEAGTRHALAQALHRTGEFQQAREEMACAADLTARRLGEEHPDTWISRFELGRLEMDAGMPFEGLARMEQARVEVERRLGSSHPVVAAMRRWL